MNQDSITPDASNRLYVFEGPVDCLSHASITQIGNTDWDGYRLSLGGVSSLALNAFIENHPQINQVYLCLDNDGRGNEATERISREILEKEDYSHISIFIAPPPDGTGKDFNDTLLYMKKTVMERTVKPLDNAVLDARNQSHNTSSNKKRHEPAL